MFIRFTAGYYKLKGVNLVDVYDHKTGYTKTFKLTTYKRIEKYLSHNGGVIYGKRKEP